MPERRAPDWTLPAACIAPLPEPAPPCAHCGGPSDGWPGPRRGDLLCRPCWQRLGDERRDLPGPLAHALNRTRRA